MITPSPRVALPAEYPVIAAHWASITGVEDSASLRATIASRFAWWLGATPAGEGVMAVVEEAGAYLGVAGWCPKRLRVGDESLLVAEIGTTMTAPAARGRGVFSSLVRFLEERARERGVEGIYGTPNAASGAPYVGRLGFTGLWPWSRWIRPVGGGLGRASSLLGALRGPRAARAPSAVACVEPSSDWEAMSACWDRSRDGRPAIERTAAYLRWRYPAERYTALAALDRERVPLGWIVVGATERLGRESMALVDFCTAPELADHGTWLVRQALGARPDLMPGARLAFAMTAPDSAFGGALLRSGFVARPSDWALIGKALGSARDERALFEPLAFVAGDSDTV